VISVRGDFWGIFENFVDFGDCARNPRIFSPKNCRSTLAAMPQRMLQKNRGVIGLIFEKIDFEIWGTLGVRVQSAPAPSSFVAELPNFTDILRNK
jgi:hypothetical protein